MRELTKELNDTFAKYERVHSIYEHALAATDGMAWLGVIQRGPGELFAKIQTNFYSDTPRRRIQGAGGGVKEQNRMNKLPCKQYLYPELSKLANSGDLKKFLEANSDLSGSGLPEEAQISEALGSKERVVEFVDARSQDELQCLLRLTSKNWRKNGVHDFILAHPCEWTVASYPVGEILLGMAESDLKELFERHSMSLTKIAQDEEVTKHKSYSHSQEYRVELVDFPICIGGKEGGGARLKDGMHRAIYLAQSGAETLDVCCPS